MAIEQNLAQLSNVLVYSSMAVYTGAFGAFVADLGARGARAGSSTTEKVAWNSRGAPI